MRGSMTPRERTMSLYSALSPAMLPRAQMAWCVVCVCRSDDPVPYHTYYTDLLVQEHTLAVIVAVG